MAVSIVSDLDLNKKIWRYMTLDKFIHLLDSETLYFSSLASFMKSDPFEGMPPIDIIKKIRKLVPISKELQAALDNIEIKAKSIKVSSEITALFDSLLEPVKSEHEEFRKLVVGLFKGHVVNCWHANEQESEAMWKLYGDSHRGIAVQTTVGKLQSALQTEETIKIAEVIYSNYEQPSKEALRHLVKTGLGPVMKRQSYSHEAEVRAYFLPSSHKVGLEAAEAKSQSVKLDSMEFIESVVISPFAGEPYTSAVKAVSDKYNLSCAVKTSDLLHGFEELFNLAEQGGLFDK
ncbi:MAG: DUF2971 domain-containing protein [Pseudomonas fluorescens]|nr:DUF2971 domain-containing protein [Pseudomonas fluorescens]